MVRTYKKNFLVRTYIQQPKHIKSTKSLQIYDENENRLTIQDIKKNNKIIAILEGLGIKFTSSSFHLELCLRQAMVLEDKPIFQKCLIQIQKPVGNEKITLAPKKNEDSLPDTQVNIAKPQDNDNTEEELEGHVETDNEDKNSVGSNIESVKEDITDVATDAITENVVSKDDKCNIIKTTNIPESDTLIPNKEKHLEQNKELCEINVDISGNTDAMQLKAPIIVYREIYKKAKEKAKMARRLAIQAFLEAKKIKNTFLVGEIEESDDDFDSFVELPKE